MPNTRSDPSPRYRDLVRLYQRMHEQGDPAHDIVAERMFVGSSLPPHVAAIRAIIARFGAKTIIDYGAGKGEGYQKSVATLPDGRQLRGLKEIWGLNEVTLYDPAYRPFSRLPEGRFDGVVCTDVLEHCPEEDLGWIIDELFGFARLFVFAAVAVYPSDKTLPNGENPHITLRSAGWWTDRFVAAAEKRPDVRYFLIVLRKSGREICIEG